jgi:hypothetical protein
MKKYILASFAVIFAIALVFTISAFKNHKPAKHPTTSYYYKFTGSHGNESTMSLWQQVSLSDYNGLTCPFGSNNSCKIINTTNSGTNPTSVPLDANGFPQVGTVNTEVKLKN